MKNFIKKYEILLGWLLFMGYAILFILLMNYIFPRHQKEKQVDDTEHLWQGDNGIEFYE